MNALHVLMPEILIGVLAFVVLGVDLVLPERRKSLAGWIAAIGMLAVAALCAAWWGGRGAIGSIYRLDDFALLFKVLALLMGAVVVLMSLDYARRTLSGAGEYYGLIVLAVLGMVVMTGATELLTAYIGLELLNFSLYVLVSYRKWNPKSNEAGTKYILLGAISSAVLLYGISLLYGLTGETTYAGLSANLVLPPSPGLIAALVLVLGGLGFKIAAVPFHMWAPDVYEGAPTPVTSFLAVAAKAAGFGLLVRLFAEGFLPVVGLILPAIAALAAVTMVLGNTVAIRQSNIKRLLAYSSIGQVGYLLVGLAVLNAASVEAIVLHIAGYAATNFAAFLAVVIVENRTGDENVEDYAGLAEREPFAAFALVVAFFSLAGMPLLAGFVTKFYLFLTAAQAGVLWLVAIAVTMSVVSLYYYLMVMKQMYVAPPSKLGRLGMTRVERLLLGTLIALVIAIGIAPEPLFVAVRTAVRPLF
ncbi:MAG: NADH-quinone oxidoreductase subunit N [Dehalococcoidia bacterium]